MLKIRARVADQSMKYKDRVAYFKQKETYAVYLIKKREQSEDQQQERIESANNGGVMEIGRHH